MEAYTNFENTMKYYDYDVLPFNFAFIINLNAQSSAQDFKREMDAWLNAMPREGVANWVVCINIKLINILIRILQINCSFFTKLSKIFILINCDINGYLFCIICTAEYIIYIVLYF